jgi:hypothetical protein
MARKSQGRTIVRAPVSPVVEETMDDVRAIRAEARSRKSPLTEMSNEIAGTNLFYKNWYYPGGREIFPTEPHLWYVDKMYPEAQGGMLLIDEPACVADESDCRKKALVFKEGGMRYLILTPSKSFEEALIELEKQHGMDNGSR